MLRKIFVCFLITISLLNISALNSWAAQINPPVNATSAILVDAKTGQILYQQNANEKRAIASTTKMMTAIVVLENRKLDEIVTVSQQASDTGEEEMYLAPGEQRSVEDLIYGILLKSANDAAIALAEHTAGSVEKFAEMMNAKAKAIGANNTNFTNPHGLNDVNHYSTAYDLALMGRYALGNPKFAQVVASRIATIPWPGNPYQRTLENHNKLLKLYYPYATGIKTGYTKQAGHSLAASAKKNNIELISVILNAPNSQTLFSESRRLLEFGFKGFAKKRVIYKKKLYGALKPKKGDSKLKAAAENNFDVLTANDKSTKNEITTSVVVNKNLKLPIIKGQKVGLVEIKQRSLSLGTINLKAENTVEQKSIFSKTKRITDKIKNWLDTIFAKDFL
ncbi:MAG: D-alanyl-D-alanine carboxypeptidase [Actinobacteria bacterium]|nr:D-alanyl-D-alanine carboxypeptidase [Actinomycetota bacterium]